LGIIFGFEFIQISQSAPYSLRTALYREIELLDRYQVNQVVKASPPGASCPKMIAERFGGLDDGLLSRDRRGDPRKIETEPKIRKWFQDLTSLSTLTTAT
jgi:hypothetical protein